MEDIEPEEEPARPSQSEGGRRMLRMFDVALAQIANAKDPRLAVYQIAYGLGAGICAGKSMKAKAAELGCTRAAISKGAVAFCREHGLPPSPYMKSQDSRASFLRAREGKGAGS